MRDDMFESRTLSVPIARPPDEVYDYVADLGNLPRWSYFTSAEAQADGSWVVGTPSGPLELRIVDHNRLGVLDHVVRLASGEMRIPMRVVANGDGAEVLFTVFRAPGMTDEAFAVDVAQVEEDLARLRDVLEGERPASD